MTSGHEILLVGGAESLNGSSLPPLLGPGAPPVCGPGRALAAALPPGPVVVVPMTLGRDPELPGLAAQTLLWAARERTPGDLLLARPPAGSGHLVGRLRGAVVRAGLQAPAATAVVLVAPAIGPEPDAELFKIARLVRQYTPVGWVEVALTGGDPDVDEGVERCRLLGAGQVVLLPASFVPAPRRPGVRTLDPPLGRAALATLVHRRAAEAERRWAEQHDDGLAQRIPHTHTHGAHGHEARRPAERLKEVPTHVG